jgi:hypothetical protein
MLLHSTRPFAAALPKRGASTLAPRVFASGEPQVSNLFRRSETGDALVAVDVPVRLDSRVAYGLSLAIRPDTLHRVLVEQRLPADWSAALVDGRGVLVSRTTDPGGSVGQPAQAASVAAIAAGETPFSSTSQDGVPIRAAHAAVPGTGWTAVVAVPNAQIEAPLRRALLTAAPSTAACC